APLGLRFALGRLLVARRPALGVARLRRRHFSPGRCRPSLARLVTAAAAAPTPTPRAVFLALLIGNRLGHGDRKLGGFFFLLFLVFLDQGRRLDRTQRRRLAGAERAQPLEAERWRDQRIIARHHDPHAIARLDLGQRFAFL